MLPSESTTRSETAAHPGDLEGLVVAPGREQARPLVDFLRGQRLNIQLVNDAEMAFEEALIHPPNVILLDESIGTLGGIELCARLKGNTRTHFVPVVIWSNGEDRDYHLSAWEAGADAIFTPVTDERERRARLWALLKTHALYRRQERKHRSQGSQIQTHRRWVDAFVHDLQSSVSALQANVEFLGRRLGLPNPRSGLEGPLPRELASELTDCLNDTKGVFSDMNRGLRTILDYERIEAGRGAPRQIPTPLDDLLAEVLADLKPQADASAKVLSFESGAGIMVSMDRELMRGAVYNLIAQCLKHPANRKVSIHAGRSQDGVRLAVSGDRATYDASIHGDNFFEPYCRTQHQSPVGHGLGMALAKAVARLHGGTLEIEPLLPGIEGIKEHRARLAFVLTLNASWPAENSNLR